ncbi:EAL domain-containing protein [Evansella sp. LMS18]|uniref:putative bifunctional diguanylate cyclase/phosphodiesterase n=1 Tax=Evansella sp. LMS18 TaxID=2924033 RepID=UPI0020D08454|nr:GGDEF and EAL domain-containing protein [Evansella sp. LMS18]UTR12071.1 EAL domain-containing protein [Evansella sp. LMS18]
MKKFSFGRSSTFWLAAGTNLATVAGVGLLLMFVYQQFFSPPGESWQFLLPAFSLFVIMLIIINMLVMRSYLSRISDTFDKLGKGHSPSEIKDVDPQTEIGAVVEKFNTLMSELSEYKEASSQKAMELDQQQRLLERVINQNPNGIYAMNYDGVYRIANKAFADLYDSTPEEIIGLTEEEFNPSISDIQKYREINREVLTLRKEIEIEDFLIDQNGTVRWFHIGKVPINHGGDQLVLTVATEITDRKAHEQSMEKLAYYDDLTSLPNRKSFQIRLAEEIERKRSTNENFTLLFLDLDRFKYINDTFGHDAGDAILIMASERLSNCLSGEGVLFRLGGDEFTILFPSIQRLEDVTEQSKRILAALGEPYNFRDNRLISTGSIGVSIFSGEQDVNTLTKQADIAMYKAKEQGKNTFRIYTKDMESEVASKLRLEMDLYNAVAKEELFLQYQPIIDTMNGDITGMEALIRWEHPQLGLISPNAFIPIAEETGLIHVIGEWVLYNACRQQKEWLQRGMKPIKVSVNLSPVQLTDENLYEKVKMILQETELEPELLELEITESTIMENKRTVVKLLKRFRRLGVRIAIDDFGTGYSSLNVLKRLPVDTLKVDRSIVQHLLEREIDDVILNAVFDIAKKMNLTVVAEGIETKEQLLYLKGKYCHNVQGFFFSQPLTNNQFVEYVRNQKTA